MANVKDIYKAHWDFEHEMVDRENSKYHWAAYDIFGLTTYDGALSEMFVKAILEVCKVILDGTNFEYIMNQPDYIKYILVCQLLDEFHWIEWGTSIRGAWFEEYPGSKAKPILEEQEWSEYNDDLGEWEKHVIPSVPFSKENIKALIEFMEE